MKRIALHTIGCKLNYAETATIGNRFASEGYIVVDIDDLADIVVINTCSVTERTERECRQIVRRALRRSPNAFVAVIGCYSQLRPEEVARISGVDLVLGSKEKISLIDFINGGRKKSHPEIVVSCIDKTNDFEIATSVGFKNRTRAFLKVQDGCDYNCTFCTIPLARGKSRSTTIPKIMIQAREAVMQGYKEIVLTGVNVGDYGRRDNIDLLALLQELVTIDGLMRIRISSIEPNLLTDNLLDFWSHEGKLCNHWHIPLQAGCDEILRKMRRRYLTAHYADRVGRIKSYIPDAGIGADVIVGFPGESETMFSETYKFIDNLPLSYLHVFSYSERPNTSAVAFEHRVDPRIKTERSKQLRQLSIQKRQAFYKNFIGKSVPVLFETTHPNGIVSGLTEEYVRIDVRSNRKLANEIFYVNVTDAFDDKCIGELTESKTLSTKQLAINVEQY